MHAHQFWWAWPFLFQRYCYLQKQPNFPFRPLSSKNSIDWNQLKKIMQVGIDVKCMHINFGGRGLSGFGDIATFKNGQISLSNHGHQKIQSIGISSKKSCKYNLMSNACTPILVGMAILVSEILLPSITTKFPFPTMDYYNSPWSSKNYIDLNQLKKIMQVGIDVKCIHVNFGGRGLSGFGDIATFKNGQISLSDHGL